MGRQPGAPSPDRLRAREPEPGGYTPHRRRNLRIAAGDHRIYDPEDKKVCRTAGPMSDSNGTGAPRNPLLAAISVRFAPASNAPAAPHARHSAAILPRNWIESRTAPVVSLLS